LSPFRLRIAILGLLASVTLGIIGFLTYYFKDYVRQVLALPVTRMWWFLRLLIDSTPQVLFWAFILILLLVISIRSLSSSKPAAELVVTAPLQPARRERIAFLKNQIALSLSGDQFSRARMAGYLGIIALNLLAHQQKEDSEKIRLLVLQDKLEIPPEIEAIVKARFRPVLEPGPGFWESIWFSIRRLFPFLKQGSKQQMVLFSGKTPGDELAAIILYLEEQLEDRHDSRD